MEPGSSSGSPRLAIGEWVFVPAAGELCRAREVRRVEPIVAAVLRCLAAQPGEVVSRARLFETVWPERVVVDEALTRAVSQLRAALDDVGPPHRYLETLPKRGYRLVAPVATTFERCRGDWLTAAHRPADL